MKFKSLDITNFLTIGQAQVALNDRGLVLVQGENKDDPSANSNGAGKSSIPDALCWALFGVTARDVKGDDVINRTAKKGTRVAVTIEDGADVFRVIRHRKHKTGKNTLQVLKLGDDGGIADLSKGTDKLTQEVVAKIIGCSYEVFRAAIYAGQEDLPDLPAMTDKQLKLLIEEAAGINLIEEAYKIARTQLGEAKTAVEAAESRVERAKERVEEAREAFDAAGEDFNAFDGKRKDRVKELAQKAKKAKQDADDARVSLDKMVAKNGTIADIDARIAEIDAKLRAMSAEKERETELATALANYERAAAGAEAAARHAAQDAKAKREAVDGITSRIGSPCGECGKEYSAGDMAEAKRLAVKAFNDALADAKERKAELDKLRESVADAREALAEYRDTMSDPTALLSARNEEQRWREIQVEQGSVVSRHLEDARRLANQAKEVKAEENPHGPAVERAEATYKKCQDALVRSKERLAEVREELALCQDAVEVYGPAGVRAHILDDVTPFLNARTADYLGLLSDGNITATWATLATNSKGEVREKFNIEVANDTGGGSFKALSGGEKRKVRVACALALQDLVASRASKPIDLWIGDEVDDALDAAGLERLMGVLEDKARERGTVLVISHSDLKDWIRQEMTVVKDRGYSTIKEAA